MADPDKDPVNMKGKCRDLTPWPQEWHRFHRLKMLVRVHGNIARIEVLPEEFEKLVHEHVRNRVYREMKAIGFSYVTMDLGGYRTGRYRPYTWWL